MVVSERGVDLDMLGIDIIFELALSGPIDLSMLCIVELALSGPTLVVYLLIISLHLLVIYMSTTHGPFYFH